MENNKDDGTIGISSDWFELNWKRIRSLSDNKAIKQGRLT